jgi:PAS domain S-box-containing protein
MSLVRKERRAIADLSIAMTIGLLLAFLNLTLNFSGALHAFFSDYVTVGTVSWIVNGLFVWLVVMLALAYRRWRKESRCRGELEDIVSSISPDALIVVSPSRRIEMCNDSVERIFGYRAEDVLGQLTDALYFDRRKDRSRKGEIHDALERDGFHIGTAMGRRRDGSTVPLEVITGELTGRGGAVLLLRDEDDEEGKAQVRGSHVP